VVAALFQQFPMMPGRAAQVWRHQPAYRRPRHFHAEPELNLVVKGAATIGVGDRELLLGAGEALLFEPGQDHVLLEASPDLELFVMALRPALSARVQRERSYSFSGKIALTSHEVRALGERAACLENVRDPLAVECALADVFATLSSHPRTSHVTSRRAVGQLRATPALSGAELARRLRAHPSRISREFHDDLGLTLVEYRARLRLMRFVSLVDSGRALGHAAIDADFGSYAQCHRVFQRALGCSPRAYFAGARTQVEAATEPAPARP
jgi:AraC-like DNA-binding protein/mannose-6-phosphate isomerase-like protein (cupin superfamily)